MSYKIVRYYADDFDNIVVKTGLTLEEAQAHCEDPETSSSTCTNQRGLDRTAALGPWFEGYEKE